MKKPVLIIAISARPFVEAAAGAGYAVTAIDAFADRQTVDLAEKAIVVDYDGLGFNASMLLAAIQALDLSRFIGFVYGSGFEAQPDLLQKIAERVPLIGNSPEAVSLIKNATSFFAALDRLNIRHPKVLDVLPADKAGDYLRKCAGGSGGMHVRRACAGDRHLSDRHYYQQQIEGRSVSLLFVANGSEIEVVGFNEQWVSPSDSMPFRYGGAVSGVALPESVRQQLITSARQLTRYFGLFGLNSIDAIVQEGDVQDADGKAVFVLEINPRLSATVDLYDDACGLFDRHVQTSLNLSGCGRRLHQALGERLQCRAHAIVYAVSDIAVAASIAWPGWVVDNPTLSEDVLQIPAGVPVCTVLADADDAETAKKLAQDRVEIIHNLLLAKK